MSGKRHHYIPRFLLRRFAVDPTDRHSQILRLDRKTGRPRRVNPAKEAARSRYYQIQRDDGSVDESADEALDRIESEAAPVIASLSRPGFCPTLPELERLALFVATLKTRTPEGREHLRETDAQIGRLWIEMQLSDPELVRRAWARRGQDADEIEAERLRLLEQLGTDELVVESTPSREVALMFLALEQTTEALMTRIGWTLLRSPSRTGFVLSDHPVAHHDPTPKTPEAGAGFLSSPGSTTTVPLDPAFALVLQPREPAGWREVTASDDQVADVNLRTYAWATDAVYGPSQAAVTGVRALARRKKSTMTRFAKRPPRLWITETTEGEELSGRRIFTSTYKGETVAREFYVDPPDRHEARRRASREWNSGRAAPKKRS